MIAALVVIHVLVCFFLIGVVLLQQGKSADLAGAFGGQGSQTAFGPRGATSVLTKMTTYSAILFMITAISLTIMMSRHTGNRSSVLSGISDTTAPGKTAPAKPATPPAPAKK